MLQQLKQVCQTACLSSMEGGVQKLPNKAMLRIQKSIVCQCQRILVSSGMLSVVSLGCSLLIIDSFLYVWQVAKIVPLAPLCDSMVPIGLLN